VAVQVPIDGFIQYVILFFTDKSAVTTLDALRTAFSRVQDNEKRRGLDPLAVPLRPLPDVLDDLVGRLPRRHETNEVVVLH